MAALDQIGNLAAAGWSGVAAVLVGLVWWLVTRRDSRKDKEDEVKQKHREEYLKTKMEWLDAIKAKQPELVAVLARKLDWMRSKGWHLGIIVATMLSGCQSAPPPEVKVVPLGDHVRIMQPGQVLPDLPKG